MNVGIGKAEKGPEITALNWPSASVTHLPLDKRLLEAWGHLPQEVQHDLFEKAVVAGHKIEMHESLREQLAEFLHQNHRGRSSRWCARMQPVLPGGVAESRLPPEQGIEITFGGHQLNIEALIRSNASLNFALASSSDKNLSKSRRGAPAGRGPLFCRNLAERARRCYVDIHHRQRPCARRRWLRDRSAPACTVKGATMPTTANEYRRYAKECMDSARDAASDPVRKQFLDLAKLWMTAAERSETQSAPSEPISKMDGHSPPNPMGSNEPS
jgi:hypothetical protein